jgi:hypothetical protein
LAVAIWVRSPNSAINSTTKLADATHQNPVRATVASCTRVAAPKGECWSWLANIADERPDGRSARLINVRVVVAVAQHQHRAEGKQHRDGGVHRAVWQETQQTSGHDRQDDVHGERGCHANEHVACAVFGAQHEAGQRGLIR